MPKRRENLSFLAYCGASGSCGALSAACGKAAGQAGASTAPGVALYAAMVALNAAGLALFSAALSRTASLQATAASVAFNVAASGLLGWTLHGEAVPLRWWMGLACLTAGVALVQPRPQQQKTKKKAT